VTLTILIILDGVVRKRRKDNRQRLVAPVRYKASTRLNDINAGEFWSFLTSTVMMKTELISEALAFNLNTDAADRPREFYGTQSLSQNRVIAVKRRRFVSW
jgi:hypothetical protein